MHVVDNPTCRGYHGKKETVLHNHCEFDYFFAYRFEYLGLHIIDPWELVDMPILGLGERLFVSVTRLFYLCE